MKPRSQVRSTPPARRGVRVRIAGGPYAVVTQGDLCVVFWGTIPLYPLRTGDRVGRYLAAIGLVRLHGLSVMAVAKALRIGRRTMYRLMDRFDSSGVDGLYPGWGSRKPTKIRGAAARRLLELKRQGVSNREAARRLGVSPSGVAHALRRLGWKEPPIEPAHVPPEKSDGLAQGQAGPSVPAVVNEEAQAAEPGAAPAREDVGSPAPSSPVEASKPVTADVDPTYRAGDRLMARLGLLEDAAPLFLAGPAVPRAGVLLALPALIGSGIFDVAAKVYGTLGPSFYGLRTSVLALLLMALLRIKRPENLKEVPPAELGRILGLDRGPEVKTLRRKLEDLSDKGKSVEFLDELAKLRAAKHADCLCYLYIDGHVRVYNGDAKLAKTYVTQRRLALPGTTDYWVNDRDGQPLLVVTAEANEGLAKMLLAVLQKTRPLIGDRRPVVAFDRGGWSPKLFQAIINDGWDILTYRKGKTTDVSRRAFRKHTITIDGREVSYTLAERRVRFLGGKLKLRQITKLGENDHQTHILTSKSKAPAAELAYRMFGRWRQENYFKYMRTEFALDALVENGVEQGDPNRSVPNPERKAIEKKLAAAKAALAKLERKYGAAAFDNKEGLRRQSTVGPPGILIP